MTATNNRLGMVEAGRALAALSVVLFHVDTIVGAHVHGAPTIARSVLGERGVDFFFVLSGFIITFVHAADVGRPERTMRFVLKRVLRIYPLLWLVAGAVASMNILFDHDLYGFETAWTSFTLWPSLAWPSPTVVWTLRHEVLFYALFATLILSQRAGLAICAVALLATLYQTALLLSGHSLPGLAAMIFSPLNLQFAVGCLVAWAFRQSGGRLGAASLAFGLAMLGTLFVVWPSLGFSSRPVLDYQFSRGVSLDLGFAVVFGLIVYGLAAASQRVTVPRFVLLLGAASYAIYLVHTPVMGLAGRLLPKVVPAALLSIGAGQVLLTVLAVAAGVATHLAFELPVGRFLSRRLFAPAGTTDRAAAKASSLA